MNAERKTRQTNTGMVEEKMEAWKLAEGEGNSKPQTTIYFLHDTFYPGESGVDTIGLRL